MYVHIYVLYMYSMCMYSCVYIYMCVRMVTRLYIRLGTQT